MGAIERKAAAQDGVVSRRQVLELGGDDVLIERMLRHREWARIHPGVYVDHTGVPTPAQLDWAAVLVVWPAALSGRSALRAHGLRSAGGGDGTVDVAVGTGRRVVAPPGVRVRRVTGLDARVMWHRSPPRMKVEDALVLVAASAPSADAYALLADACQERRTTADRLFAALETWCRLPGRVDLEAMIGDVRSGALSVLERRYLHDVERAHGLPPGGRQWPFAAEERSGYRDVLYDEQRVVVELDGRRLHDATVDRAADLDRDLDATAHGLLTARVGWTQVQRPCDLASRIGEVLALRGWTGRPQPCSPSCSVWSRLR